MQHPFYELAGVKMLNSNAQPASCIIVAISVFLFKGKCQNPAAFGNSNQWESHQSRTHPAVNSTILVWGKALTVYGNLLTGVWQRHQWGWGLGSWERLRAQYWESLQSTQLDSMAEVLNVSVEGGCGCHLACQAACQGTGSGMLGQGAPGLGRRALTFCHLSCGFLPSASGTLAVAAAGQAFAAG